MRCRPYSCLQPDRKEYYLDVYFVLVVGPFSAWNGIKMEHKKRVFYC